MQGTLLAAAISPDNTPHGYNLTFLFPEILFVVVAAALYLRFRSRHLALLSGRRPYVTAGRATATVETGPANGDTTHGSTLQEGEATESPTQGTMAQATAVQEATEQETTEEGE